MRSRWNADILKNLHKRACFHADLVPRPKCHQHCHGPHIEYKNPPDDLIDGLRNGSVRIFGFAGCNANQLYPAKREHDNSCAKKEAPPSVRQKTTMRPEVADVLRKWRMDHKEPSAERNHEENRHDLHQRHPKLHLSIGADAPKVECRNHHQTDKCRKPLREIRQPEIHIDPDRGKLCHGHNHIVEPVVPTGKEPRKIAPVFACIVTEGP